MSYRVGLFITCLVDAVKPAVGVAAYNLLKATGATVLYKPQTCCGQIAYSSGYTAQAKSIAKTYLQSYDDCDYVVAPSGSCVATFRHALSEMFPDSEQCQRFQQKCLELSEYLQRVNYQPKTRINAKVTFHDSCAGLRELGIKNTPRQLLQQRGVDIIEMADCEECCGFGGLFSVKHPDISAKMGMNKCQAIKDSGAVAVVAGDVGCLLHLEGLLLKNNLDIACYHWAQLVDEAFTDKDFT